MSRTIDQDLVALQELRNTAFASGTSPIWSGSDPCEPWSLWEGIECKASVQNGDLQAVNSVQLRDVHLGGSLPEAIGNLTEITKLVLVNASLGGVLPVSLGRLAGLQDLVLSRNRFNGAIPDSLTNLHNLENLDLSLNDLSGVLPNFSMNVSVNVTGNRLLCTSECPQDTTLVKKEMEEKRAGGSSLTFAVIFVCALSAAVVGALSLALLYYYWIRKKSESEFGKHVPELANKESQRDHQMLVGLDPAGAAPQVFTYRALQLATNNFSPANIVGEGGFGSVYRAVLPNGSVAAVKRLDRTGRQGEREFKVEVYMLSSLSSPYLLRMIGYCADMDHRLLVYEYMPNGSLQEHLHSDGKHGSCLVLDWNTRLRIALDAARGLEYLHEKANPPVIHRDFKSSNVLLDQNFCAKVSDFGLAKLGPERAGGHVSTRVLGTQGYVAPEYALTGHLTTKSDVYSYGVVLLELLTGRLPVDSKRPLGETVLVSWALPMLNDREQVLKMVDPALQGQFAFKDLVQVAAVATTCVQQEAEYRPLMTDVVQSLVPLVKIKSKPLSISHGPDANIVDSSGPSSKVNPDKTVTPP
ncbi:hypothetical protein CBR_g29272 [Chara braunii]|uniref:Protein kinase domain-containing protein n=1 Tax=Chara braunii TaxID=69332 RepID=A0A388LA75_CHABU|nr:hypothetical protein CBR_g29272 [Chara braunii]|eukprot:GBG79221.1 hypothetical protein CBR_g29272 [Chara braunii]